MSEVNGETLDPQDPNKENKWSNYFKSLYNLGGPDSGEVGLENPNIDVLPPDEESAGQAVEFLKRSLMGRDIWDKAQYKTGFDNWAKVGIPKGSDTLGEEERYDFQNGILCVIEKRWVRDSERFLEKSPKDWEQRFQRDIVPLSISQHFLVPKEYVDAFVQFYKNKPDHVKESSAALIAGYYENLWDSFEGINEDSKRSTAKKEAMYRVFNDNSSKLKEQLIQSIKEIYKKAFGDAGESITVESIIDKLDNNSFLLSNLIRSIGFNQLKELGLAKKYIDGDQYGKGLKGKYRKIELEDQVAYLAEKLGLEWKK